MSLKVHTDEGVYDSKLKLYEYLDFHHHFIRINKSTIVNKSRINTIRPGFNMKLLIEVDSKWLEVNRTYYYDFKKVIGI